MDFLNRRCRILPIDNILRPYIRDKEAEKHANRSFSAVVLEWIDIRPVQLTPGKT